MKPIALSLLFCCCCFFVLSGQSNIIKARFLQVPAELSNAYTFAIGYERMLSARTSLQLLYSHYGYDDRDNDGGILQVDAVVLAYRRYFGKDPATDFHRSAFVGIFHELTFT